MGLLAHLIIVPAWVIPPGQLHVWKMERLWGVWKKGTLKRLGEVKLGDPFFGAQVAFDQMAASIDFRVKQSQSSSCLLHHFPLPLISFCNYCSTACKLGIYSINSVNLFLLYTTYSFCCSLLFSILVMAALRSRGDGRNALWIFGDGRSTTWSQRNPDYLG